MSNRTLQKFNIDKIIDDFEGLYYPIRNKLAEIKRSRESDTEKSLKAIKLIRHFFRTSGRIA